MNEIEKKLLELWELLKEVPQECKGMEPSAYENRRRWMKIRSTVHELIGENG